MTTSSRCPCDIADSEIRWLRVKDVFIDRLAKLVTELSRKGLTLASCQNIALKGGLAFEYSSCEILKLFLRIFLLSSKNTSRLFGVGDVLGLVGRNFNPMLCPRSLN